MKKTTIGVIASLLLTLAIPAAAQTDAPTTDDSFPTQVAPESDRAHGVEGLRSIVVRQIEHRLYRVDRLQQAVRNSEAITTAHAEHLTTDLNESEAGLKTLKALARSANTVEQLRSIQSEMIHRHRIFVVRSPQTELVIASDIGVKVADRLDNVATKINEAADRAEEAGFDVAEIRTLVAQGHLLTREALAVVDPVAEAVIPLEPSDYPDPAKGVLRSGRDSIHEGRQIFRNAADSLRDAAELLAEIIRSKG